MAFNVKKNPFPTSTSFPRADLNITFPFRPKRSTIIDVDVTTNALGDLNIPSIEWMGSGPRTVLLHHHPRSLARMPVREA